MCVKHRFILHSLSHTTLVIDISGIGLPGEIYPEAGKREYVSTLRFKAWDDANRYLLSLGADGQQLDLMKLQLNKIGVAVLTVI